MGEGKIQSFKSFDESLFTPDELNNANVKER
jgi:hypothetical protein